jgi:hypothetical protein
MAYDQMMDVWRVAHSISPSAQKTSLLAEDGTAHNESSSDEETDDSDATLSDGDDDIDRTQSEASLVDALGIAHPMTSPEKTEKKEEPSEEELARRRAISDVGPRPEVLAANVSVKLPVTPSLPKTECQCQHSGSHYTNVALDAVFPGSIETLYNLLFNSSFISNFLVEGEKSQGKTLKSEV